jgi:uncharacterized protein YbjT (DUF2867 family)
MRYFLTGATGFIGGSLARQLREGGHAVVALVRDPARAKGLADLGVILVQGDITDRASLLPACAAQTAFFTVPAGIGWVRPIRRKA